MGGEHCDAHCQSKEHAVYIYIILSHPSKLKTFVIAPFHSPNEASK